MLKFWSCLTLILILSSELCYGDNSRFSIQGNPAQITRLTEVLLDIEKNLPTDFINAIDLKTVKFKLAKIDSTRALRKGRSITISSKVLDAYNKSEPKRVEEFYKSSMQLHHKDMNTLLKSMIIHELAHIFDDVHILPPKLEYNEWVCDHKTNGPSKIATPACSQSKKRNKISNLVLFRNVFEWDTTGSKTRNHFDTRSPDIYEFSAPKESFAVNFEYFILDQDYACRYPARYRFFKDLFRDFSTDTKKLCLSNKMPVVMFDDGFKNPRIEYLDFERLHSIHYLMASPGDSTTSKFGHAMLRLVFCAPGKPISDACVFDLDHHYTVNFVAATSEMSAVDSLTGKYPIITSVEKFLDSVNSYTYSQNRNLVSLPLRLSEQEKLRVFEKVFERVWTYESNYRVLSNNCTSGVIQVLQSALPHNVEVMKMSSIIKPLTLFKALKESGLTDLDVKAQVDNALLFESTWPKVLSILKFLQSKGSLVSIHNFEDFRKSDPYNRFQSYRTALRSAQITDRRKIIFAVIALEDFFAKREAALLWSQLRNEYLKKLETAPATQLKTMHDDLAAFSFSLKNPARLIKDAAAYGIPNENEIDQIRDNFVNFKKYSTIYDEAAASARDLLGTVPFNRIDFLNKSVDELGQFKAEFLSQN